ncbi:MAG: sugar phosphate isomerase/epimerase [Clostridia bacterium]|nr:sugar phosphate isomerase/epimerase [Clostridia bacterium]
MNRIGMSSACFYPKTTEESFLSIAKLGVKTAELFFNTPCELEDGFVSQIKKIRDDYGIDIVSVHPFLSFTESATLFSNYERRFRDFLPKYSDFLRVVGDLGARYFVIHGAKIPGTVDDDTYCERFEALMREGERYGVTVAHENVVEYRGEDPKYLRMMSEKIGPRFRIVYDLKQARRAGYTEKDFFPLLAPQVCHIHVSDHPAHRTPKKNDCIPPGEGVFDFAGFFADMKKLDYAGDYIIELYDWSWKNERELIDAKELLERLVL